MSPGSDVRIRCSLIVERFNFHLTRTEQARETALTAPIAPGLTYDSRRHRQRIAVLQSPSDQHDHAGLRQHFVEQRRQLVQLGLLFESYGNIRADACCMSPAHRSARAFGDVLGQADGDLLGRRHTGSMTTRAARG